MRFKVNNINDDIWQNEEENITYIQVNEENKDDIKLENFNIPNFDHQNYKYMSNIPVQGCLIRLLLTELQTGCCLSMHNFPNS